MSRDICFQPKNLFSVYDRLMTEMKRRSQMYDKISSEFGFLSGKVLNYSSVSHLESVLQILA